MKNKEKASLIQPHFRKIDSNGLVTQSERDVLGFVRKKGSCTQAELTTSLVLSQQSLSRIVARLEAKGMLNKGRRLLDKKRGQPSTILSLNPEFAYSFGISLMADSVDIALINFAGQVIDFQIPKIEKLIQSDVLSAVTRYTEQMLTRAGIESKYVFGVGVATTGFRINKDGVFNPPSSLDDFALIDLEKLFSDALQLPVWAENDGKTAAIAESMVGVGRSVSNFAYFYIATGFGGGIISEGKLFTGSRGNAGEFSSILPMTGFTTPNLETLRVFINKHGANIGSVSELIEQYNDGWAGIEEWLIKVSSSISLICSATSAILDTEAIVLGGRLPKPLANRLIPHIRFFDKQRRKISREHARVYVTQCEHEATTIGAAHLPFTHTFFDY